MKSINVSIILTVGYNATISVNVSLLSVDIEMHDQISVWLEIWTLSLLNSAQLSENYWLKIPKCY